MHIARSNDGEGNGRVLNSRPIAARDQQQDCNSDKLANSIGLQRKFSLVGARTFDELTGTLVRHLSLGDRLDNPFLEHILQTSDG